MNQLSLARWVRATWLGWLLGIPCIVLLALAGEVVGAGNLQVLVGVAMGIGVGLMQSRALQPLLGRAMPWIVVCVVGLGLPFLVTDIARIANHPLPVSLPPLIVLGGTLVGSGQAWLLRSHVRPPVAWVLASVVGWSLAAGTTLLADLMFKSRSLTGVVGAVAYLGIVAAGGALLGVATGGAFRWLRHSEKSPFIYPQQNIHR